MQNIGHNIYDSGRSRWRQWNHMQAVRVINAKEVMLITVGINFFSHKKLIKWFNQSIYEWIKVKIIEICFFSMSVTSGNNMKQFKCFYKQGKSHAIDFICFDHTLSIRVRDVSKALVNIYWTVMIYIQPLEFNIQ